MNPRNQEVAHNHIYVTLVPGDLMPYLTYMGFRYNVIHKSIHNTHLHKIK